MKTKIYYFLFLWIIFFLSVINETYPQTFELIGPPGGHVEKIYFQPQTQNLYLANDQVLFKYNLRTDFLAPLDYGFKDTGPYLISFNPVDTNYIYIENFYGIVKTNDGGKTWRLDQTLKPTGNERINIRFNPFNPDIMWVMQNVNELWKSTNKGDTWFKAASFEKYVNCFEISKIDTNRMYLHSGGDFYISDDAGISWEKTGYSSPGDVNEIYISKYDHDILFTHEASWLKKSIDGGKTFEKMDESISAVSDFEVFPDNENKIIIARERGIQITTDGGLSWEFIKDVFPTKSENLKFLTVAVNPENTDEIYVGERYLGCFKSTDEGYNWELTNTFMDFASDLYIDPTNEGRLIASPLGWCTLISNDYGKTWYQPELPFDFYNVFAWYGFNPFQPEDVFMSTSLGLFKTTDFGESWLVTEKFANSNNIPIFHPTIEGLLFTTASTTQGEVRFLRSSDGGENWIVVKNYPSTNPVFDPINSNIMYIVEYRNPNLVITKSTDYGLTWTDKTTGIGVQNDRIRLSEVRKDSSEILYALKGQLVGSNDYGIYKTTNGGDNWFKIKTDFEKFIDAGLINPYFIYLDETKVHRMFLAVSAGGDPVAGTLFNGGLFVSENDGKNWTQLYDGDVGKIYSDNSTPRNIYFNTPYGLMRFTDTLTTSVNEEPENIPEQFALYQNYPNPFNPSTVIRFSIPTVDALGGVEVHVSLKIYDILGREVQTLVNKQMAPGTYEVEFDASGLSSGVYFYRLSAKDFTDVKKMVILK